MPGKRKRDNAGHAKAAKEAKTAGNGSTAGNVSTRKSLSHFVEKRLTQGFPSPYDGTLTEPEVKNVHAVTSAEEIEITVETLQTLAEHPALIKSKACKELRKAVYDFRQACPTGMNAAEGSNLTARISGALTDGKYTDALILLVEMRIKEDTPSLGALQRWVRTLDVVSGLSIHVQVPSQTVVGHNAQNDELIRVLDAILRVTGPTDTTANGTAASSAPIALQETWNLRPSSEPTRQVCREVEDKSLLKDCPRDLKSSYSIVENTSGPERKPPNLYPSILYATVKSSVLRAKGPRAVCYTHPIVPDLRLIKDVLAPNECAAIIASGETVGFTPDAPSRPQGEDTSVLAHNFYWVVDQGFHDLLWSRVKEFVPEKVEGRKARGINRRFRVYRYVPGAEYRCHIDGAWPPSGFDSVTGAYKYDASDSGNPQSSLFTFLIYLNDDFKGGETTFFIPSVKEGVINAYPVKPIMGSVAMFPHGEAEGALLHEGTGVVDGAKYVIRTDVEYDVVPSE